MSRWARVRVQVAISVIRWPGAGWRGRSCWLLVRRGASPAWPPDSAAQAPRTPGRVAGWVMGGQLRDAIRVCAGRAKALSGPALEGIPAQRGGSAPQNPIPLEPVLDR